MFFFAMEIIIHLFHFICISHCFFEERFEEYVNDAQMYLGFLC